MVGTIDVVPVARHELQRRRALSEPLFALLDRVRDPELPVLSIWDLGILQDVRRRGADALTVTITPTYSGCPAMDRIQEDIVATLEAAGYADVRVEIQLAPAWTTDWMSAAARRLLREYGVAPPDVRACPQCGSEDTETVSEFGSTACKALLRCRACGEPFDHFKAF